MIYTYHTHTHYCDHATGTPREYIERAISVGIKKMGFSEHIPFVFPNGTEYSYRLPMARTKEYIDTIAALKEEYRDKIEIHTGFETEYIPSHFDEMVDFAVSAGAEYLILGQHSVGCAGVDLHWSTGKTDDVKKLKEYTDSVVSAMESGKIFYVAHPDIFNFTGDSEIYRDEMRRVCKASSETGVPLEINFLGIRQNRRYPKDTFWEIAGEVGCRVVFGMDAHDCLAAGDLESLPYAEELVKKYKLTFLDDPKIKMLK